MDWKEKIKKGIDLIIEGCDGNPEWALCSECPFRHWCDMIEAETNETPDEWEVVE